MDKRFWICVVATFVMFLAFGFLVHGILLAPDYAALGGLFRSEADQTRHFPFMLLAHLLASFAFVWIYARGKENKPAFSQGLRYGLAVAVLMIVAKFLIYYAVQPMPGVTVAKQIVFDTIGVVVMGIVVAHLSR
jgi:uncharacterized membrane protein